LASLEQPLFSEHWHRVKGLRPSLRTHIKLLRQEYRKEIWYVLKDSSSARFHRFNAHAYHVIGLMDGRRTVHRIWEEVNTLLGDDALVQDEIIHLLGQLHQADALQSGMPPDVSEMFHRAENYDKQQRWGRIKNPMVLRVPLVDPDSFLNVTMPWTSFIYTRWFLAAWCLTIGLASLLAAEHWPALLTTARENALKPSNLALLLCVYPAVKLLHELGHAYAVKKQGGEVHEIGMMFLVFMPVPYVDATASTAFPDKGMRILVSAVGVMAELLFSALALFAWLAVET